MAGVGGAGFSAAWRAEVLDIDSRSVEPPPPWERPYLGLLGLVPYKDRYIAYFAHGSGHHRTSPGTYSIDGGVLEMRTRSGSTYTYRLIEELGPLAAADLRKHAMLSSRTMAHLPEAGSYGFAPDEVAEILGAGLEEVERARRGMAYGIAPDGSALVYPWDLRAIARAIDRDKRSSVASALLQASFSAADAAAAASGLPVPGEAETVEACGRIRRRKAAF